MSTYSRLQMFRNWTSILGRIKEQGGCNGQGSCFYAVCSAGRVLRLVFWFFAPIISHEQFKVVDIPDAKDW